MDTPANTLAGDINWEAEDLYISIVSDPAGRDPYDGYRRLREIAPVLRTSTDALVLTRYEDCDAALRHRSLGKSGRVTQSTGHGTGDSVGRSMLFSNPPEHTRLRRLVSSAFTTRHTEQLRGSVTAQANALVAGLRDNEDFISAVALPLPVNVISDLLGVPHADRIGITPLVHDITGVLEPFVAGEAFTRANSAQTTLAEYFSGLLAEKRRSPADDLLSRLAAGPGGDAEDDALDDADTIATAIVLFGAGYETTVNLLGNGLRALLEAPDQFALLRQRPELLPSAVEEMLRYDSPIQINGRNVLEPTTLAGLEVEPGQLVVTMLGAANRDPAKFTDPDRFDITRDDGPHLAFSSGIHFCLGAQLARLEADILFTTLLATYSRIELAGDPVPRPGLTVHGLEKLPVAVTP
ncbi:cytochrome P450 [Kitasatospora sp. NPDC059577]|uniref:cytochrome P450 n=1 Tax=unclassified Kitasatospora TaxID=2633591 RepID=UPI0036C6BFC4